MSDPKRPEEKPPERPEEPKKRPNEEDVFHPHRHGHVVIGVPQTGVTHLDPGVVDFS